MHINQTKIYFLFFKGPKTIGKQCVVKVKTREIDK